jgi:hypothetical protein
MELTDDDMAILQAVYRHRFVRADDLYRLIGRSPDRLSRRLTLLFRNEYLDRPIAQIDRYRAGGSQPLVYGLGAAGARYLKGKVGAPIGKTDWRSRNRTYTRDNLEHTLAVARFLIDLELACRETPRFSFIPFEDILAQAPEATRKSQNPMSWSVTLDWRGGRTQVNLAPDAIFGLRMMREDGKAVRSYYFLELDRGTMTIAPSRALRESDGFPFRATILRKFYAYADSYHQKLHEKTFAIKYPRTLFLTTSEVRASAMANAAREFMLRQSNIPPGAFLFGTVERASVPGGRLIGADGTVVGLIMID